MDGALVKKKYKNENLLILAEHHDERASKFELC